MLIRDKGKGSIILQVMVMFWICVMLMGLLTYISEYYRAGNAVMEQVSDRAEETAEEVRLSINEYPAHEWLLGYWHEHWDEMDIEYDVSFNDGTETSEKCRVLAERHPGLQLKYAGEAEIAALPEQDQKLYAEIVYSWIITRINQIKRVYGIDFLFCAMTEKPYTSQFFLFSAADEGAVRGTEYEQVYTLGVTSEVAESQRLAMENAVKNESNIAEAGNYMDYYSYMETTGGRDILIGLTYKTDDIMAEVGSQRTRRSMSAMIYQVVLLIICAIGILILVLRPLKLVQGNIREYKDEKDSTAVRKKLEHVRMNNEIGELATDVIELTEEIDDYVARIEQITSERERMEAELSLAKAIQSSMLPHIFPPYPERTEFDIFALMDPAREVGGDFYDFFMIDDDHLCLVIADVSGKGIPAALFMMISRLIIKINAMNGEGAADILEKTNDVICEDNQTEMFVTTWLGILEISSGIMRAANAGHEYPAIRHPGGGFELLKDKHGFVIGGMEDIHYKEYELRLEPGAAVFVYTDGVPEASDPELRMFGTERMTEALNEDPAASPEELIGTVRRSIDEFTGEGTQFDDITMLCLEYTGAARSGAEEAAENRNLQNGEYNN